jgi:hypothetical protein
VVPVPGLEIAPTVTLILTPNAAAAPTPTPSALAPVADTPALPPDTNVHEIVADAFQLAPSGGGGSDRGALGQILLLK